MIMDLGLASEIPLLRPNGPQRDCSYDPRTDGALLAKIDEFTLDLCADYDCFRGKMMLRIILNEIDMSHGRI